MIEENAAAVCKFTQPKFLNLSVPYVSGFLNLLEHREGLTAARVSSWLNRLHSYGSIKVLKVFVFPLLVSRMVLLPQIPTVLSCQLTQVLSDTYFLLSTVRPIFQSRPVFIVQRTLKGGVQNQPWNGQGTVNCVPVFLCRECRELIACGT